jgi:hypothetical protein
MTVRRLTIRDEIASEAKRKRPHIKPVVLSDLNRKTLEQADSIGEISDGYHTFDELYAHRMELWITLCRIQAEVFDESVQESNPSGKASPGFEIVWKSRLHSDGSNIPGWFVMGIYQFEGCQITYHLPEDRWYDCDFAETLDKAPEFDGHTSADVLERLKKL